MTVHNTCHTLWEDVVTHVCGRNHNHDGWHLCPCGAILYVGKSNLTDEQIAARSEPCTECLARAGRPCHTKAGAVMSGVHATRSKSAAEGPRSGDRNGN